jgi:hypothetical protein
VTAAEPAAQAAQNAGEGRSPVRSTPRTAVAAGSRPTITAPCALSVLRRASAVNSGKPSTTPTVTTSSDGSSERAGRRALRRSR